MGSAISRSLPPSGFLGIEAGGTRTTARWESEDGTRISEDAFGPANLQLIDDASLVAHFLSIAARFPSPRSVAIGMAGARTESDRERIRATARVAWPDAPCLATNDLETAFAAAGCDPGTGATVLVLCGTGSCCYGRALDGCTAKIGGWGHVLGDDGSGYDIAIRALRLVILAFDDTGRWGPLGQRLLADLQFNEPNELIPWAARATKTEIAALAPVIFDAEREDPIARDVLRSASTAIATAALTCAGRLAKRGAAVRFLLSGGLLQGCDRFAELVARAIRGGRREAVVVLLERPGAAGAVELARNLGHEAAPGPRPQRRATSASVASTPGRFIPVSRELSPTEQRNPRSVKLDSLSPGAAIELMLSEDARISDALRAEKSSIERALRLVIGALRHGGRLFYAGAGTSGRLGILDASECPPTFRTPPELVQGIIAGGEPAIFRSVEGAEDDFDAGARAVDFRGVRRGDVVVGIAASGRTPFMWGALVAARESGAKTVLLCFNPHLTFPRGRRPDVVIAPKTGPEILTGSTRLKAGTATKLVLNMLTTLAMARLGKVEQNLMIDVNPANAKLRERAVRIVCELTQAEESVAHAALETSGWIVKDALRELRQGRAPRAARRGTARSRRASPR